MLPEFTQSRSKLARIEHMQMAQGIEGQMGVMGEIASRMVHEGDAARLYREDGTVQDIAFKKVEVKVEIPVAVAEKWTEKESTEELAKVAGRMAKQKAKVTLQQLDKEIDKVGNSVDAKGNFTAETMFEAYEKMLISFDGDGNPTNLALVSGEKGAKRIAEVIQEIEATPELLSRWEDMIGRKREEWYAREADRTLVG